MVEYLAANFLDGELSALLKSNPTARAFLPPDKMTAFSRPSRFGMTFAPLTENLRSGVVDVISGGFPCQDISVAGKGVGISGARSGLWREMARIVGEVRPRYVFVENSPALVTRGLGTVLGDLAALGYDARWTVLGAADVGAPHQRDRLWIVADSVRDGCDPDKRREFVSNINRNNSAQTRGWPQQQSGVASASDVADAPLMQCNGGEHNRGCDFQGKRQIPKSGTGERAASSVEHASFANGREWWRAEPDVGRMANGVAARVDRLKAIGNGQVPLCAATAWRILSQ